MGRGRAWGLCLRCIRRSSQGLDAWLGYERSRAGVYEYKDNNDVIPHENNIDSRFASLNSDDSNTQRKPTENIQLQ